jgi:hypothetical protein
VTGEEHPKADIGGLLVAEYFNDMRSIASFFQKKKK